MKKVLSLVLCISLLASIICVPVSATTDIVVTDYVNEAEKQSSLDEFSNELNEMIEDNTALYEEALEETTDDVAVTYDGTDYTYNDFATCRLIIRSYKSFGKSYGADEAVTGYEDLQVIQYESVEETINAFNSLSSNFNVTSVVPDNEVDLSTEESTETTEEYNWAYDRVRVYEAIKYIEENYDVNKLPEVRVGILDTGVWTEDEEVRARVAGEYSIISNENNTVKVSKTHANVISRIITDCTTANVKIYSYQCCDTEGKLYVSNLIICEERMLLDNLDMVNFSFGSIENFDIGLELDKQGVLVIAAAGNNASSKPYYPASAEYVLSVASMNVYDKLSSFSNRGFRYVDVIAPGENLPDMGSGTSFACPFVVSLCAMILSVNPEYTREEIEEILYSSCDSSILAGTKTQYGLIDFMNALTYGEYKNGLANAPRFSLESRPSEDTVYTETQYLELICDEGEKIYYTTDNSYPSRQSATLYTEPIELNETTKIQAVTFSDSKYRSEVSKQTIFIQSSGETPADEWTINSKGYVTGYNGFESEITVPETINGITVIGIGESAFEKLTFLEKVTLPETVTYIDNYAFKGCKYLERIDAPGVVTAKIEAFMGCRMLDYVNMSKLTNLSRHCFYMCGELIGLPVENFTKIPQYAFSYCTFSHMTLPNVTEIQKNAFSLCSNLIEVSLPSLTDEGLGEGVFGHCLMLKNVNFPDDFVTLGGYTFSGCNITDFSFLKNIQYVYWGDFNWCQYVEVMSLPSVVLVDTRTFDYMPSLKKVIIPSCTTVLEEAFRDNRYLEKVVFSDNLEFVGSRLFVNCPMMKYVVLNGLVNSTEAVFKGTSIERVEFNKIQTLASLPQVKNSIVALPSTFKSCSEDTTGRNYKVFGTKGSTAEAWAEENGHTFYEISQENSIVTDVVSVYDENSIEPLTFDAIGINSSYQWYGSLDNKVDNGDDVAIKGANTNEFTPEKGDKYPYYYCKMTSTDKDVTEKEVSTVEIFSSICQNKLCYMMAKDNTEIDYVNKIIFTKHSNNTNLSQMLGIHTEVSCFSIPSYVYRGLNYFGTGSLFNIYENGVVAESYTVIVEGDINGDSIVDVLDASVVEQATNNHKELTGNYHLAGDSNRDGVLDVVDYQAVVNRAIA